MNKADVALTYSQNTVKPFFIDSILSVLKRSLFFFLLLVATMDRNNYLYY